MSGLWQDGCQAVMPQHITMSWGASARQRQECHMGKHYERKKMAGASSIMAADMTGGAILSVFFCRSLICPVTGVHVCSESYALAPSHVPPDDVL